MTKQTESMRVVVAASAGGPDVLTHEERPVPIPNDRELLVSVAAAGVNRPDVMQRIGDYPPPPGATDVLGLEMAGEVIAVGSAVSRYRVGDLVMGLVPSGGYATQAIVDERNALPVPRGFTLTEAAAIPETFFTVWTNVFDRAQLREGERLLVHGGTSGIGTTAIQLAKAMGAEVIATAGSDEKCRFCESLGAAFAINYRDTDFVDEVKSYTGGAGVDVVLDMVAGDYVNRNLDVLAIEGRLVQIALMQGYDVRIDLRRLMPKRATLTGSTLRPRPIEDKAAIAAALEQKVAPLWQAGKCRPVIDSTFAFEDVVAAHERMDAPHIGKVVLLMKNQ
ncbi:NAD(P)H quinone oxidoreductase [Salinisphaera dokdonensis CL-ES53]|uniref:NAD(P)H quinone oxidoreductase n=1 Tax=Salinisphaera dokdonensis CL-ES53 TaxID=1304272 RepID=A0ABV2B306_9GAMM